MKTKMLNALRNASKVFHGYVMSLPIQRGFSEHNALAAINKAIHDYEAAADKSHEALVDLYHIWMAENGLQLSSADEHLHDPSLTERQRVWLRAYSLLWDLTEEPAEPAQDEGYPPACTNPSGHEWVTSEEDDRSYCCYCGADGDA